MRASGGGGSALSLVVCAALACGRGVPEWRLEFDAIPLELPAALASESWGRRPSEALKLPRPMRVITRAERSESFSHGIDGGWAEFHRRYPASIATSH